MYSTLVNQYFRRFNPRLAQYIKRVSVYPRYYRSLHMGRINFKKYRKNYKQHILFVAGLPKSGTTWMENMLASHPGITPIMPYQVTAHEMKYKSSIDYDFPDGMFEPLKNGLFVLKMHSYGSKHNVNILKKNKINYCIIYRDLRDAALSHCFYVKSTPWHPECQEYRNFDIKECLKIFCSNRLDEWINWIRSWRENRDKEHSIEITYEELLRNTTATFSKLVQLFELDNSNETIQVIIEKNRFSNMKKKDSNFFRKGVSGDWKNYFDDEIKGIFKDKAGDLLRELGYEKDLDW